jgi:hypothetical protein
VQGDYWVRTPGAVVEDLRIEDGVLYVDAPDVTLRRVEVVGGIIDNEPGSVCRNGLLIEDTTVRRGTRTADSDLSAVGIGGYTARNVKIDGTSEGFRVGGKSVGCGPVVIEDSWVRASAPDSCGDWHGDGIQGYDGPALTVRNTYLELEERSGCYGTAPFFYPSGQGNTSAVVDGLVVKGGGYPFRLGTAGVVRGVRIVDGSWGYGPISVACSLLTTWSAELVRLDAAGQPVTVRSQSCNTEDGR